MTKLLLCFLSGIIHFTLMAQTTTGRVKWVSGSNVKYTYTGELKDGKPHGRGLAISEGRGDTIVFGEFKNGMINGSTVVKHSTGTVVVANWTENKLDGTSVTVTSQKTLIYGNYIYGNMEGNVTKIYVNNGISIENIKNGSPNVRVIYANPDGNQLTDIIYVDGEPNGPGYQYQMEGKQMFEGIWAKGNWVRATTGNYPSFMRSPSFGSSKTDDHIMMYTRLTTDNYMQDTGFLYYPKTGSRQFGYFNNGKLENGIKLLGDKARIIGRFYDGGWEGLCVLYEKDKILDFGNYTSSKGNGKVVHVLLDPLKIIDGFFSDDRVSGKASILDPDKSFTTGYYENGLLSGEALTVRSDGSAIKGIYKDGALQELKEMSLPSGVKLNVHPKDVCTAINFLVKEFENNFKTINSRIKTGKYDETYRVRYTDAMDSWYYFPGAAFNRILPVTITVGDFLAGESGSGAEFTCGLLVTKDYAAVKKKYDILCQQLTACTITSLQKGKAIKLIPKLRQQKIEETSRMASLFNVPSYNGKTNTAMIRVMIEKNYDESYQLTLDIISK